MTNKLIFIIISAVVIVVVGGILAWQLCWRASMPELLPLTEPSSIPSLDETADWEVYRNEEYGFELKYRNEWTAKDWAFSSTFIPFFDVLMYVGENQDIGDGSVCVAIYAHGAGRNNINELVEKPSNPKIQIEDLESVSVGRDSYSAKKFVYNGPYLSLLGGTDFVEYFIEHNNRLYIIHYDKTFKPFISKNEFDYILSTFRFIN